MQINIISWQYAILILLIILFFIWACFGGGNYKYIGLSPLEIGYDAAKQTKHKCEIQEVDNTPNIPNLDVVPLPPTKEVKVKNIFLSESYDSVSEVSNNEPATPRTAALGEHKCHVNGFISKGEQLCKQAIEEITGKPFFCVRPNFLKNPETGRNLELDLYNDELKIGVEYSSNQHYQFPNSFHKTYEEFINQVRRDQYKVDTCDANGVYLITVPYNVPLTLEDIKKYINYYMPENAYLRN